MINTNIMEPRTNKEILRDLEKDLQRLRSLNARASRKENYVVVDSNNQQMLTVENKKGNADVGILSHNPHLFTDRKKADHIASTFKATNGYGRIEWQVWELGQWMDKTLPEIETQIKLFSNLKSEK